MRLMKRAAAVAAAFVMSMGVFSGYAEELPQESPAAVAENEDSPSDSEAADSENDADTEEEDEDPEDDPNPSRAINVEPYAKRLREIGEAQKELDEKIKAAEKDIKDEQKLYKAVMDKLDTIDTRMNVLNSYMTALEINIKENEQAVADRQQQIEDSIDKFKRRLRALYIAGGEGGYLDVLLSSQDFFDVLMRTELVKRVAEHDDRFITELTESKKELEKLKTQLDAQKADYEKQQKELESQRKEYEQLAAKHKQVNDLLKIQKDLLKEENNAYIEERKAFEADLSGLLKSNFSDTGSDAERQAAELEASAALDELHAQLDKRKEAGEEIGEDECRYVFMWPVPGVYYISYGVGARWGSYHEGIDISGDKYDVIRASESGTVVKTNTSCPHDYGKTESCGCGGGYGNYIIIDHGNDFLTLYGHLTEVDVKVGDKVKQGDHIGFMGSTGFSTGDHLHFEIRYKGNYLDPAAFVVVDTEVDAELLKDKPQPRMSSPEEETASEDTGDENTDAEEE